MIAAADLECAEAVAEPPLLDPGTTLLSLALTLRPLKDFHRRHLGRAAHALCLRAIGWRRPELAEAIHAASGPKPFTASDVFDCKGSPTLRLTALTGEVAEALAAALTPSPSLKERGRRGPLAVGEVIDLDGMPFRVEVAATRNEEHPWAGQTSYGNMALPSLYRQYEPEARVSLEFASPTTFRSNEMNIPVPMPGWVFGSLLERWNAFAPVALPEAVREFAATRVALSRYNLRTEVVPFKDGAVKFGAVGTATYITPRPELAILSALNLLADFAFYAGVGAGTTMGFGQCRQIGDSDEQRRPDGYAAAE